VPAGNGRVTVPIAREPALVGGRDVVVTQPHE
jgi:hypothetical protein